MTRFAALALMGGFVVCAALPAVAAPWMAASTTATAITGDITLTQNRITFASGKSLPLAKAADANDFEDGGDKVTATIYRVTAPADLVLRNGNHLCGSASHKALASYIAVWRTAPLGGDVDPRSMAVFAGGETPKSSHGSGLCGVFNFEAGTP